MKRYQYILSLGVVIIFVILQSTLLQKISVYGVIPDIALIVVVFTSNSMGAMRGQTLGFFAGLVQDLVSSGPLGFNVVIKTVTGYLFGKIRGKLFLDSILLPVVFVIVATLMKEIMISLIVLVLLPDKGIAVFGRDFFIEAGLNAFISPFIFALLRITKIYKTGQQVNY